MSSNRLNQQLMPLITHQSAAKMLSWQRTKDDKGTWRTGDILYVDVCFGASNQTQTHVDTCELIN